MQNTVTQNKAGCIRTLLLIFLLTSGPTAILIGSRANIALALIVIPTICTYIIAIIAVSVFEPSLEAGAHRLLTKLPDPPREFFKRLFHPTILCAVLGLVLTLAIIISHAIPSVNSTSSLSVPSFLPNGNGIGLTHYNAMTIGLIDEGHPGPFDATDMDEKPLEDKIFAENQQADAGTHFTLTVATTLSTAANDENFSVSVGLEELRGAYLSQYYYNQTHQMKLRLVVANIGIKAVADKTTSLIATNIAQYARSAPPDEHFIGVVGFPFSVTAQSALTVLQQNDILVVSSSSSSDLLSNEPNFFRIEPPNVKQSNHIPDFILHTLKSKNIAVLYDPSDPYSGTLGTVIQQRLDADKGTGVKVTKQTYTIGSPASLNTAFNALSKTKPQPDLLFFAGYPDDLDIIKEQLQTQLPNTNIMGGQALYELGAYTKDHYTHLYFNSFAFPDAKDFEEQTTFDSEYIDQFQSNNGGRSTPHAVLTYDAVTAFERAVAQVSNTSSVPSTAIVKNALMNLSFQGATGPVTFNGNSRWSSSDPSSVKPMYIVCVDYAGHAHEVGIYDLPAPKNMPEDPKVACNKHN